jgi:hypothetical protein
MQLRVSAPVPKRSEKIALVVCPVGTTKPEFTKLEERASSPHDARPLAKRDSHVQPAVPFLNALPDRQDIQPPVNFNPAPRRAPGSRPSPQL